MLVSYIAHSVSVNLEDLNGRRECHRMLERFRSLFSKYFLPLRGWICKPLKEPRNQFPAGTTTLFDVPVRQVTKAAVIDSLESIPGLLKRLQIRAQDNAEREHSRSIYICFCSLIFKFQNNRLLNSKLQHLLDKSRNTVQQHVYKAGESCCFITDH